MGNYDKPIWFCQHDRRGYSFSSCSSCFDHYVVIVCHYHDCCAYADDYCILPCVREHSLFSIVREYSIVVLHLYYTNVAIVRTTTWSILLFLESLDEKHSILKPTYNNPKLTFRLRRTFSRHEEWVILNWLCIDWDSVSNYDVNDVVNTIPIVITSWLRIVILVFESSSNSTSTCSGDLLPEKKLHQAQRNEPSIETGCCTSTVAC